MEFEIREVGPDGASNSTILKAHRVVVSSRCPWFRRALTSGMKESIERRIVLHDVALPVFQSFLHFLYAGLYRLDLSQESANMLADLLLLADRYEVDQLKDCCEEALLAKVDSDSCFALLALADQFQAGALRRTAFQYIAQRPSLSSEENLAELPSHLKEELSSLGAWVREGVLAGERRGWRRKDEEEEDGEEEGRETEESILLRRERRSKEEEEEGLREVEQLTDNMRLTARDLQEEEEVKIQIPGQIFRKKYF